MEKQANCEIALQKQQNLKDLFFAAPITEVESETTE